MVIHVPCQDITNISFILKGTIFLSFFIVYFEEIKKKDFKVYLLFEKKLKVF